MTKFLHLSRAKGLKYHGYPLQGVVEMTVAKEHKMKQRTVAVHLLIRDRKSFIQIVLFRVNFCRNIDLISCFPLHALLVAATYLLGC